MDCMFYFLQNFGNVFLTMACVPCLPFFWYRRPQAKIPVLDGPMSRPYGFIILCRAVIDGNCTTESYWHQEDLLVLNRIKNSVVGNKNTPHFGAKGKYYSFGINALYKIDEKQSLLGTYGIKSSKDQEKNKRIIESSKWMEDKLVDSLLSAITS